MSVPAQNRVRVQKIAEAAVERARLSVVPRTRVRAPRVPFVMLVSAILLAGVVGLLMFNTTMQQNSFTQAALETQAAELRSEEQALRSELEALRDGQRIMEEADRMGMVIPTCARFLYTATGKVTGACPTAPERLDPAMPAPPRPDALTPERRIVKVEPEVEKKTEKNTTRKTPDTRSTEASGDGAAGSNGSARN